MLSALRRLEPIARRAATLVTALALAPALLARRLGSAPRVPILMYHQVGPDLVGAGPGGAAVRPEQLERQLRAIRRAGYHVVGLDVLVEALVSGRLATLRRAVVLTFDDGYRGQFAFAYPILSRWRMPATFFLVSGCVGRAALPPHLAPAAALAGGGGPPTAWWSLSWDEVREMQQGGMHFGSHGWTHRSLGRLRPGEALAEAAHSRRLLERRTGERVRHFAYPFGSRVYGDCDATARAAVSAAGYQSACTTAVGRVGPGADPLLLPRIPIDPGDGPFLVRAKLAGAFDWMGPAKRLWQRLVPRREQVDWPPARDAFAGSRPLPSVGE